MFKGPPCYTNFATDYQTGDPITFNSAEKQSIQQFMDWYLGWWPNKLQQYFICDYSTIQNITIINK